MTHPQQPQIELRFTPSPLTRAADTQSRCVQGYAAVFDTEGGNTADFLEVIRPGAFDGVIERSDVLCLLNHNTSRGLLARSVSGKGSLQLTVDTHGLFYTFDAPATALGDELLEGIRRGDISQSSFCFTVEKDNWEQRDDGVWLRTVIKVSRLYDVSPVYQPFYPDTTVTTRTAAVQAEPATLQREKILRQYGL